MKNPQIHNPGDGIKTGTVRHGWNISEWCVLYGFSRTFYYRLKKQGKAPATVCVYGVRLITAEADAAWSAQLSHIDNVKTA